MNNFQKIVLIGINSRFNHTNLAIRYLTEYAKKNCELEKLNVDVSFQEYTINQNFLEILNSIKKTNADVVLFSVYIWNVELSFKIISEIKKIMPSILIGCGGPEVSYVAEKILQENKNVDFIISGEGERTFADFINKKTFKQIPGIYYRSDKDDDCVRDFDCVNNCISDCNNIEKNKILWGGERKLIEDLSELPFPYPDLSKEKNKIFYYESSRGCPFNCSYCLSSIDKSVRFVKLEKVFSDLKIFLDERVPLVKFVDRTFNLNEKRYIAIWNYIIDNWNGVTTFHFEIAAHTISENAFEVLEKIPKGAIQFEIGVQSVNPKTLAACGRNTDFEIIEKNVSRIPKTIHMHLDLIAGLPLETLEDFALSFNKTICLKPEMLQLGFLKILNGTKMEEYAQKHNGYNWLEIPPYEVLSSPEMSYDDLQYLKQIEKLLDIYFNSGSFSRLMNYIIDSYENVFEFLGRLLNYFSVEKIIDDAHKMQNYFEYFYNFIFTDFCPKELDKIILEELLRFDFVCLGKCSGFPKWYVHNYSKDLHHHALCEKTEMHSTRLEYAYSEYEEFKIDIDTFEKVNTSYLILYSKPDEKKSNGKITCYKL